MVATKRQVVIVTGSRDWTDADAVYRRLSRYPKTSILIHGACPTGADRIADQVAREHRWTVLPVPFFAASPSDPRNDNRNAILIALGKAFLSTAQGRKHYDVTVEAFPPTVSRPSGTHNCMRLAREAGLPVFDKERP